MGYSIEKLEKIPENISMFPNSPKNLYVSGNIDFPDHYFVTIVGARKCTPYGISACKKIIQELSGYKIVVISGLALGIDAIAHKQALDSSLPTIAVVGSGLNESVLYPRTNLLLAKEILAKGGGLLSEFEPETKAAPYTFPMRNRIMAAMSDVCLVIECEELSGTLITAKIALEYNKEVCAVPGSIFSSLSIGTHNLINDGAHLIRSGKDVLDLLGIDTETTHKELPTDLTNNEKMVLELLSSERKREDLIELLDIPVSDVQSAISLLEIKKLVKEEYGLLRRV